MVARRAILRSAGLGLAAAATGRAVAAGTRSIPQRAAARVIIDNDFFGDPDGLVALAHQLLAPRTMVTMITVSALSPKFMPAGAAQTTAALGRDRARELLRRGRFSPVPCLAGAEDFDLEPSPAAQAIVDEAMREHPLPLLLTCGGPLTNVAAALRLEPRIAGRMTVIWIGGGGYPDGGWEYNLATNLPAAKAVFEDSTVPLWQIPQPAYRQMLYSVAEMDADLRPISPFSRWLYDSFTQLPDFVELGGAWPLGDSPLVLLSALSLESCRYTDRPARRIAIDGAYGEIIPDRRVRVFEQLDARLTFADFIARMRLHASAR